MLSDAKCLDGVCTMTQLQFASLPVLLLALLTPCGAMGDVTHLDVTCQLYVQQVRLNVFCILAKISDFITPPVL